MANCYKDGVFDLRSDDGWMKDEMRRAAGWGKRCGTGRGGGQEEREGVWTLNWSKPSQQFFVSRGGGLLLFRWQL